MKIDIIIKLYQPHDLLRLKELRWRIVFLHIEDGLSEMEIVKKVHVTRWTVYRIPAKLREQEWFTSGQVEAPFKKIINKCRENKNAC